MRKDGAKRNRRPTNKKEKVHNFSKEKSGDATKVIANAHHKGMEGISREKGHTN